MMKIILTTLCAAALSTAAIAQSKLEGNWEGKLDAGGTALRMVVRITEEGGKLYGKMDSPDQGATGIPIQSVTTSGDTVMLDMSNIGGNYKGYMMGDEITGVWFQRGMSLPMDLKRTDKPTELVRPQTPKPPFNYISENVIFNNADKSISYGATITLPKNGKAFPAIVMITGSGAQNRDEELLGHKPFAVIADYLTNKGYAVLRVDDRGVGQTTGDRKNATSADFAKDVMAAVDYLKTRKEVDVKKIGLIGHSEGGMIAQMVAAERKDIDFIIMMAGPGEKLADGMEDQNAALLENAGVKKEVVNEYRKLYRGMTHAIITATSEKEARFKMNEYMRAWKKATTPEAIDVAEVGTEAGTNKYIDQFVEVYNDKWFNYFIKYDPQPVLAKLTCKVLAINGDKDLQVVSAANLEGMRQGLAKSKSKSYEVRELPGLNHLFQTCKVCNVQEYGTLEHTISPVALQTMSDWLDKKVK